MVISKRRLLLVIAYDRWILLAGHHNRTAIAAGDGRARWGTATGLAEIYVIAAHCESCSLLCSYTIRTARSRTSDNPGIALTRLQPLTKWSLP